MPAFLSPRQLRYLAVVVLTAAVVIWGGVIWQFSRTPLATGSMPTATTSAATPGATSGVGQVASAPSTSATVPPPPTGIPFPRPEFSASPAPSPSPATGTAPNPAMAPASALPTLPPPNSVPQVQTKYNHFPYQEADPGRLVRIGTYYDRPEFLDQEAAAAFKRLVAAARAEGIKIAPISGFRTVAQQEQLFQRQIQRTGGITAAARLSAPPGYSEHHTGYALDISDGDVPTADLKYTFEETPAYRWLQQNARQYGFELSFPDGNPQGVSFEPWHWRYIGSTRAQSVFAAARSGNLAGNPAQP